MLIKCADAQQIIGAQVDIGFQVDTSRLAG
jgi:hypothetical protein